MSAHHRDSVSPSAPTAIADSLVDRSGLADLMGYSIRRAYLAARAQFIAEVVDRYGLAGVEFAALSIVDGNPALPIKLLAEALDLAPSNLARVLDRLETRGLIARRRGVDDRRIQFIELTNEGVRLRKRVVQAASMADAATTHRLSSEECELLKGLLKKIVAT